VVHSNDGMDEISISAPTQVCELKNNQISHYQITPEDFGFKRQNMKELIVASTAESLQLVKSVLNNEESAARDIVLLNSGAAIYCANLVDNLADGIDKAKEILACGLAKQKLEALIKTSNAF